MKKHTSTSSRYAIRIQRNVPVPTAQRVLKYPFNRLTKKGWSFFVPVSSAKAKATIYTCAKSYGKRHKMPLLARAVTEGRKSGMRVWRTA